MTRGRNQHVRWSGNHLQDDIVQQWSYGGPLHRERGSYGVHANLKQNLRTGPLTRGTNHRIFSECGNAPPCQSRRQNLNPTEFTLLFFKKSSFRIDCYFAGDTGSSDLCGVAGLCSTPREPQSFPTSKATLWFSQQKRMTNGQGPRLWTTGMR